MSIRVELATEFGSSLSSKETSTSSPDPYVDIPSMIRVEQFRFLAIDMPYLLIRGGPRFLAGCFLDTLRGLRRRFHNKQP